MFVRNRNNRHLVLGLERDLTRRRLGDDKLNGVADHRELLEDGSAEASRLYLRQCPCTHKSI